MQGQRGDTPYPMKIGTKLILLPLLSLLAIVCLGAIAAVTVYDMSRGIAQKNAADSITAKTGSLALLTYEYLLHDLDRARQQWIWVHESIDKSTAAAQFANEEEDALVQAIRRRHATIGGTFEQILAARDEHAKSARPPAVQRELENRLVGRMLLESQAMVSSARRLSGLISHRIMATQYRLNIYRALLFAVLFATLTGASLRIARSITHSLRRLQTGVDAFGRGDLDHRTGICSSDEVGELSRAFDRMGADLRRITASRDELDREVSRRAALEESLRVRSEALASSNKELEQYAYIASHDLQEPLRKITAFGSLLQRDCGDRLTDEGRDYLRRMESGVTRMQTLINDLLSLSRVSTRAKPFAPVDLNQVMRIVESDLESRVKESGGRIETAGLPTISADGTQLQQLLQNLVGNALKFRREGVPPVVKVYSRPADSGAADRPACDLIVEDNGIGFDQKYADRIFQIFQRLHGRGVYGGSGIGLAICRKIVERHGGTITPRSAEGEGTTFTVRLPLEHPETKQGGEYDGGSRETDQAVDGRR